VKRLFYILPVLAFAGLAWFLLKSLHGPPPAEIPSVLIGRQVPALILPPLDPLAQGIAPADLARAGKVTLVNVFASWCVPCREEAPELAKLARLRGVRLVGIVYKDKPDAARAFLSDVGNPYERIGFDASGRAGIEWGISGVPETFVVDAHGVIRDRFGPLSPDNLLSDLLPAIARASAD
jgi:cytochrome c biogenesis protein CcmG/thiol:disulfide interchange protein DsbE